MDSVPTDLVSGNCEFETELSIAGSYTLVFQLACGALTPANESGQRPKSSRPSRVRERGRVAGQTWSARRSGIAAACAHKLLSIEIIVTAEVSRTVNG